MRSIRSVVIAIAAGLLILPTACGNDTSGPGIVPSPLPAPPPPPAAPEVFPSDGDGAAGTIAVDASKRFQVMDGFGTTLMLFDNPHLNGAPVDAVDKALSLTAAQQDEILSLLYDPVRGIGLNRLRMFITGAGWQAQRGGKIVTDAPYPGLQSTASMQFAAKARQKNPDLEIGLETRVFDSWIGISTPAYEIAEYIASGVDYAKSKGFVPAWVGLQNEPSLSGPRFPPQALHDISVMLRRRLDQSGIKTEISAPDDVSDAPGAQHVRAIFSDPEGANSVTSLSIHLYGDLAPDEMRALADQYQRPLWMTEYSDKFDNHETAWAVSIVHDMIVKYNCAAVDMLYGFLGSPANGNPAAAYITLNSSGTTYNGYTLNPAYYQTGQWSRYVPRGSVRIDASSSLADLRVSAFSVGGKNVIVVVNPSATGPSVTIPAGNYRVVRTQMSGTDRLADKGVFSKAVTFPKGSITTLIEQ
jgi:glucosylceramidase